VREIPLLDHNHHRLEDYLNDFIEESKNQIPAIEKKIVRKEDLVELIPKDDDIRGISAEVTKKEIENLRSQMLEWN